MGKLLTSLGTIISYVVWLLAVVIHFWTVYIAYTISGWFWGLVTFFSPFLAQIYWGFRAWQSSGFNSPYIQWIIVLVVLWVVIYVLIAFGGHLEAKAEAAATTVVTDGIETKVYHYYGFGGWLVLFAIGLVIAFWRSFNYIVSGLYPLTVNGTFTEVVQIDRMWGVVFFAEWLFNLGLISLILIVGYFCIKQKRQFKTYSIILIIFNLSMTTLLYFIYLTVPEMAEGASDTLKIVFQSALYSAIWWPYFIKSKRVANTFIK